MKQILGLILELNPFHNGHYYFINKAKEKTNPDCTIAVVSGNFTMRGDISVIDKSTKASLLLAAGIDIVLELPFISTVNSADYFAGNAINILHSFQINNLCFGVELENINKLLQMKDIINNEEFDAQVRSFINKGHSYSASYYQALKLFTNDQEIIDNFTLPNNTLAIQYLRYSEQVKNDIIITLIKRIDNNYYDKLPTGVISSATSLRELLRKKKDIHEYLPDFCNNIDFFNLEQAEDNLLFLLKYRFLNKHGFENILGVNEGIENRIATFINITNNYHAFIKMIQTKRYPINKIKRLILHILLDSNKKYEMSFNHYLRLLAASKKGLNYINKLPKETKNRIITSFKNTTNEIALTELKASYLYDIVTKQDLLQNEFKFPIINK